MAKVFIESVVSYSDGREDMEILGSSTLTADQLHHRHQDTQRKMWDGWRRVVGGRYRALEATNLADALVESAYLPPLCGVAA